MPSSWSDKRERQYEHIKDSYEDRGRSEDKAEELAARTVNKTRSESGETKSSKSSAKKR
jgi:plasmid stabilization system protein ParE